MSDKQNYQYEFAKRLIDVAIAAPALVLTAPVWVGVAVMIKLASPGPVFYTQQRVGRRLRQFRMLKFRTMHVRPAGIADSSVTTQDDPRVFRGGRWLRRTKLDELPQLLNVLGGSMSLVGPRPTVQSDYDRMSAEQRRRAEVAPGLTGWAQIRGGATEPWPARLRWDLWYVGQRSVRLDLRIMAETAWLLMRGKAPGEARTGEEWQLEAITES